MLAEKLQILDVMQKKGWNHLKQLSTSTLLRVTKAG